MSVLKIKWEVKESGVEEFDLEDFFDDENDFLLLSEEEKETVINEIAEELDVFVTPSVKEWSIVEND